MNYDNCPKCGGKLESITKQLGALIILQCDTCFFNYTVTSIVVINNLQKDRDILDKTLKNEISRSLIAICSGTHGNDGRDCSGDCKLCDWLEVEVEFAYDLAIKRTEKRNLKDE